MNKDFKDRRIIITGAGGRLGRRLVAAFVDRGAHVVGLDAAWPSNPGIPFYTADLTDEHQSEEVFLRIWSEHGLPDVVIHTIGMWSAAPTSTLSLETWRQTLDVNLTSTFLCFREALRAIEGAPRIAENRLTLIAFSSGQGADCGVGEQAAYSAAKAGIIRLVESLAAEYDPANVSVHAIAPSTILFDGMGAQPGIPVGDLANMCVELAGVSGSSLSGKTLRAYG